METIKIREYLNMLQSATVQDCLDMYNMKDKVIVINDGKVIGFQKINPHTDR